MWKKLCSSLPSLLLFMSAVCVAFAASPIYPDLCDSKSANLFFASPHNSSGKPLFRVINLADIPAGVALTASGNSWSVAQVPNATGTIDLGSTALAFRDLFLGGSSSNYHRITSTTPTGARIHTLPNANSNTVIPDAGAANNFLTAISAGGVISKAQPSFSNLSGTATAGQLPATAALTNAANSWSTAQLPNATGTIDLGSTTLAFRDLFLGGSSSNYHRITSTTPTGARVHTLPNANSNTVIPDSGAANQFLTAISAGGVISKAQPSSSNLSDASNVALRNNGNSWSTAQLPNATGTIDLGSTTLAFRDLFLGGSSTNYHRLTFTTPTGARIHTLPNANSNTVIPDAGAADQFLTAISSGGVISKAQVAFSNLSGSASVAQMPTSTSFFGGDGSSGAVTKGTTSDTLTQINATTFTQTVSTTYTPDSGCVVNSNSTQAWNGTTTVDPDGWPGGNALQAGVIGDADSSAMYANPGLFNGTGPGGGGRGIDNTTDGGGGGGGGSPAAAGGTGGQGSISAGAAGGQAYSPTVSLLGSGGGCGGWGGSGGGGTAGRGGGTIRACSVGQITLGNSAILQCNGASANAGSAADCGGGGGGGAGSALLFSRTGIDRGSNTNSLRATGGSGGAGGDASGGEGGGGAGGWILQMSPSNTGSSVPLVTGGDGNGKTGVNGTDGGTGVSTEISGTPNLPLIAHLERHCQTMIALSRFKEWEQGVEPGTTVCFDHKEVADFYAAVHNVGGHFNELRYALLQGGSETQLAGITDVDCTGMIEICPDYHTETALHIGNYVEMSNAA